jgi:hypothetical protein
MRLFAIGIEDANGVTVQRLQGRDTGELDRTAVFGRRGQHLGRREPSPQNTAIEKRSRVVESSKAIDSGSTKS